MSSHAVVIGAGIAGLCSAWYLRRQGFSVTVIDAEGPDHRGTSWGNAGMIVPSHFIPLAAPGVVWQGLKWMADPESPFWVKPRPDPALLSWGVRFALAGTKRHVRRAAPLLLRLNLDSRDLYTQLATELDDFGLRHDGILLLCNTEEGLAAEAATAEFAGQLGMETAVLDPAGVRELEPDFPLAVAGAVHYPLDSHVHPGRLLGVLRHRLAGDGVTFVWNSPVRGFIRNGPRVAAVLAGEHEVAAREIVIAAGVWSGELSRRLGVRLHLQAGKGYSMLLEDLPANLRRPVLLSEARAAISPYGSSLRVGGTMEMAGTIPGVNPARVEGIVKSALRYFPALRRSDFTGLPVWHGHRPVTPDGLPYLGRLPGSSNVTVAAGHGMMGVSLGPVTGKLVADIAAGTPLPSEFRALRVERYS